MNMTVPEKDWKYLRSVQAVLLTSLGKRINSKAIAILQSTELSEIEKYRALFRHIQDSDKIVAECFDDWRRSNIWFKLIALYHHNLLTEDHLRDLTNETKDLLENVLR